MRSEEYDWTIYHIVTGVKGCTIDEICEKSGFSGSVVQESLDRLQKNLLIVFREDHYRACSIEEYMITSRMKQDPSSDIIIENGVVRVKGAGNVSGGDDRPMDTKSRGQE